MLRGITQEDHTLDLLLKAITEYSIENYATASIHFNQPG